MTTLLFEGVSVFDGARDASVSGTGVYREEVVRALLRHGTYDAYLFLWRTPFLPVPEGQAAELESADRRARIITLCEVTQLSACDDVVLFSPAPYLDSLIPLRSTPQSSLWIASGVVQALDGWDVPYLLLSLRHADVDDADSLICPTQAGKTVVENLFAAATRDQRRPASSAPASFSEEPPQPSLPVVPLGIDCQSYLQADRDEARQSFGISVDSTLILYVGRISPISKCDLMPLFHVVARTSSTHPNIRLIVAGDDTQHRMAEFLQSAAGMLGCGDCVMVYPNISDQEKRKLFAAADIFVSPSDHIQETFGLTIAEAMAAALPVIASDWNGYKELIVHGETGFRIPTYWVPFDEEVNRLAIGSFLFRNSLLATTTIVDVEGLEFYLRLLIERPDLRKAMGQSARRSALARYDWGAVVRAYETIWRDNLLKARALRRGKSNFAFCPTQYRYQEVFSHYPSTILSDNSHVSITSSGQWFLETDAPAELLTSPNGITSLDCVKQLLEIAGASGPMMIARLADRVMEQHRISRLSAQTNIAFSLKYGFLRLCHV